MKIVNSTILLSLLLVSLLSARDTASANRAYRGDDDTLSAQEIVDRIEELIGTQSARDIVEQTSQKGEKGASKEIADTVGSDDSDSNENQAPECDHLHTGKACSHTSSEKSSVEPSGRQRCGYTTISQISETTEEESESDSDDEFTSFEDLLDIDDDTLESTELTSDIDYSEDEADEALIDWKIDISAGGVVPIYTPNENSLRLESSSNSSFAFDLGINLLFLKKYLFASVSAKYLNMSFDVNRIESNNQVQVEGTTLADIYSTEELHYFSIPVAVGARYSFGAFTPYIFGEAEPALLTAATLHSRVVLSSKFSNGALLQKTYVYDDDVISEREEKQFFLGAGAGVEFNYGYGIIYVESAYKKAFNDHDSGNDTVTKPSRGTSDFAYVPITLGLRFYF